MAIKTNGKSKKTSDVKVSKSKVVAGGKKRRLSTPVIILIAIVAVGLLTIGGYFGYSKYQEQQLTAKAENWKFIGSTIKTKPDVKASACRQYVKTSAFGPLWRIKVIVLKSTLTHAPGGISVAYQRTTGGPTNTNVARGMSTATGWWGGRVASVETYVPTSEPDNIDIYVTLNESIHHRLVVAHSVRPSHLPFC